MTDEELAEHVKATAVKNERLVGHVGQMLEDRAYRSGEDSLREAIIDVYVAAAMSVVSARNGVKGADVVLADTVGRLRDVTKGFDPEVDLIALSMRNALGVNRKAPTEDAGPTP